VGRAWLRLLAWAFRTGGRFKGEKFVRMVETARINEALDPGRETRFVVQDGSALVDLLASAEADFYRGVFDEAGLGRLVQYLAGHRRIPFAHWWRFIRQAPEVWLVSVLHLAHPPVPDVIVFVSSGGVGSPGGPADAASPTSSAAERLEEAYRRVGGVLGRGRRVDFVEIEAAAADLDAVAGRIEKKGTDSFSDENRPVPSSPRP
jgi:hypothetical protein